MDIRGSGTPIPRSRAAALGWSFTDLSNELDDAYEDAVRGNSSGGLDGSVRIFDAICAMVVVAEGPEWLDVGTGGSIWLCWCSSTGDRGGHALACALWRPAVKGYDIRRVQLLSGVVFVVRMDPSEM